MLLAWVLRAGGSGGAHRVGEGGHIYWVSCTLLPWSFLHWKEERAELEGRRREAVGSAELCPSHGAAWHGLALAAAGELEAEGCRVGILEKELCEEECGGQEASGGSCPQTV